MLPGHIPGNILHILTSALVSRSIFFRINSASFTEGAEFVRCLVISGSQLGFCEALKKGHKGVT